MSLVQKILAAHRLLDFTTAVLTAVGVPELDARLMADSLVRADLWGHQSHGVIRLSWYVERIRAGVMRSKAHGVATCFAPSVVSTCPSGVEFPILFP